MAERITLDDALGASPATQGAKPITFDEALADRTANTRNVVDLDRLQRAQMYQEMGKTDPYYRDPRMGEGEEIPIDSYLRTEAPPLQPARGNNFMATLKSSIPQDMQTRRQVLAQELFPNDPQGVNRVGFIDDKPVYVDENGQLRHVTGKWSNRGVGVLKSTPEVAGSIVGSFATGNPITGSALGAAGGAGIKRMGSALLLKEPLAPGSVLGEMGAEAATDFAGGLVGKGVASFADRGRIADFTPQNMRDALGTRERLKLSTGIDLDLAQASGNSKLIAIRAYASRYPGKSAELLQAADEAAQGQFESAVTRVMDSISRAAPAEVYGTNGMNAARMVIEAAKEARNQAVKPFYEAAGKNSISADVAEVLQKDPVLRHFAGRVQRNPLYQRQLRMDPDAKDVIEVGGGRGQELVTDSLMNRQRMEPGSPRPKRSVSVPAAQPVNKVEFWHYVQQELDDEIAKSAKEPNKVRILTQARKELNQKLEAASPAFAQANAYYSRVTRESIEPLEASAVGTLARITNPKAATAAARIFNDPNISAAELAATRASIVKQEGGKDAWNGLVRQWVASRWNKALKETQTGSEVNPAGKLRQALIGTPEDKARMRVMLPPDAVQAFDDLMEAAQSLARTPTAGSNTMRDTEIKEQLKGTALTAYRYLTSPRQAVREAGEQRALEEGTAAIAEAILNPQKRAQLRQVVRMAPGTKKAILLSGILSGKATKESLDDETEVPRFPRARGNY